MKKNKKIYVIGILLVLAILFLFISNGSFFSIFGSEYSRPVTGFWSESSPNVWSFVTGKDAESLNNVNSQSFFDNSDLLISTRFINGAHPQDRLPFGVYRQKTGCGSTCCFFDNVGNVVNYHFKYVIDNKVVADNLGEFSGSLNTTNNELWLDPISGTTWTGHSPCSPRYGEYYNTYMCNSGRIISLSDVSSLGLFDFSQNLSTISIDNNLTIHDLKIFAEPTKLFVMIDPASSCTDDGSFYIDSSDVTRINNLKAQALSNLAISFNSEYLSKMEFSGDTEKKYETYSNGEQGIVYFITFDITDYPELQERFSQKIYDTYIYVEPKECRDSSNFVTKMFTVSAGDIISLTPQVGEIGISSDAVFCHSIPVLKQAGGVTFEQDYSPYEQLKSGEAVTIPSGQNWIFFYKSAPTSGNYYYCADKNGIYDEITNKCQILPAIEYTCVSGVFDPVRKTCLTQAVVEKICSSGVYNTETEVCEYMPPVNVICSIGTYDSEVNLCSYYPENQAICDIGVFNPLTDRCDFSPNVQNVCKQGEFNVDKGVCIYTPTSQLACSVGVLEGDKCIIQPTIVDGLTNAGYVMVILVGGLAVLILFIAWYLFRRK